MHAGAGRPGDGAEKGEKGTLTVGAGDMDDGRKPLLGMSEGPQETFDAAERQIDRLWVQFFQALEQRRAR